MKNSSIYIYLLIIGIAIFTYIPRSIPIVCLSKKKLPNWLVKWMKFIPSSIFAALICPDIFTSNGSLLLNIENTKIIAAILVFIVSIKKKSLGLSIAVGVLSLLLIDFLLSL